MDGTRILVTEAALNPKQNREKMAQIIFEKFNFGGAYFESQALLSLMAEGRNEGFVFDSGDGVSHVIPVINGFIQRHAIEKLNLAGRHVTDYLVKLLQLRGYPFNSSADFETVREIKEQMCYVAYDIEKEKKLALETTLCEKDYTLPNGQVIRIG